jgi:hypothetical protein
MNIDGIDFCFYHVERCGGTFIRKILYKYFLQFYNENEIFYPENIKHVNLLKEDYNRIFQSKYSDLTSVKIILSHMNYGQFMINSKFNLVNIREPVQRAISHYYHFRYENLLKEIDDLDDSSFNSIFSHLCNVITMRTIHPDVTFSSDNFVNLDEFIKNTYHHVILHESFNDSISVLSNILSSMYGKELDFNNNLINRSKYTKSCSSMYNNKIRDLCINDYTVYNRFVKLHTQDT